MTLSTGCATDHPEELTTLAEPIEVADATSCEATNAGRNLVLPRADEVERRHAGR
jgi:PleD family two-component response regulator